MLSFFEIYKKGLAEKAVRVAEYRALPHRALHLCGTHLIAVYIRIYLPLVHPYPAESDMGSSFVLELPVYLHFKLNIGAAGYHRAVIRRYAVISRFRHFEFIYHAAGGAAPENDVFPCLAVLRGIAACGDIAALNGKYIFLAENYLAVGSFLILMEVVIFTEAEKAAVERLYAVVIVCHCSFGRCSAFRSISA